MFSTKIEKWIFVTGAPRSGTTYTGRMLSVPLNVDYIHEPFNPDCGMEGVECRYCYSSSDMQDNAAIDALVSDLQQYDFELKTGFYPNDGILKKMMKSWVGSRGPFHLRFAKLNPFHKITVVKDPIGCLLLEYLVRKHGFTPVVVVRHPVAVVASMLRQPWDLAAHYEELIKGGDAWGKLFPLGNPYREMRPVEQLDTAALLWCALNDVIARQVDRLGAVCVVRHEDLCLNPVQKFREIYSKIGIKWSFFAENYIRLMTERSGWSSASSGSQDSGLRTWGKMDVKSRRRVFELTGAVAQRYYPESSFDLE